MTQNIQTQKILYVITKSNWGGAQAYVYTLATRAMQSGADVVVALGGAGDKNATSGELVKRLHDAGIRTILVPSFMRDMSLLYDLKAYVELLRIIKKEKPDIIHVNSSKAGGISALAGRVASNAQIIFTIHGLPHQERRMFISRAFIWIASWITILLSDKTILLSKQQLDTAPALFAKKKLVCIPNGIAPYELLSQEQARKKVIAIEPALKKYSRWVVSTSELNHNKGIDVLINAFAHVCRDTGDVALVLFNDGTEHHALALQAHGAGLSEKVFFLGFTTNVHLLLSCADIFVLPSLKEGFPFALLEAGIAKLPVITTSVGGIPNLIKTDENGILTKPENVQELAGAIIELLNDTDKANTLGKKLSEDVREKFSLRKMIDGTFNLYI